MNPIGSSSIFLLSPESELSSAQKSHFVSSPRQAHLRNFQLFLAPAEPCSGLDVVTSEPAQLEIFGFSQLGNIWVAINLVI